MFIMNCLPEEPRLPIANLNRDETFLNRYNIIRDIVQLKVGVGDADGFSSAFSR